MSTTLIVSDSVINRLVKLEEAVTLRLYGVYYNNTLVVVGLQNAALVEADPELVLSFPAEIDFCGVADVTETLADKNHIMKSLADVDITDNPVFISYQLGGSSEQITANFIINGDVEPTVYTVITEKELFAQFIQVCVKAELPFTSEVSEESIKGAFANLRSFISTGRMVFCFSKNNIYLMGNDDGNSVVNGSRDPLISDLSSSSDELIEGSGKKRKQKFSGELETLSVDMLQKFTVDNSVNNVKKHGPLCILDKKRCKTVNIIIPVDALAMLHKQTHVGKMYEILVETVIRNLKLYERALLTNYREHKDEPWLMSMPQVYHFYPEGCGHFVTQIYVEKENDDSYMSKREVLHRQLLLPVTRPLFRKANRYLFNHNGRYGEPLLNPHEGLKPTDNGGEVALVRGKYKYYHYCQDNMDDNGWGCAYRSLQTLASWFILQGYSDKTVPTYKDIQKCLVDMGDKPNSFIGSRQWIGSTEVNYVLSSLLGVTSRILYVNTGEEMAYKGPELLSHFRVHGSPVMIGGGVLAHTILGVDYNRQTGSIKFLILDPHYTGGEDLHVIQSKGWCGWKGPNFWNKGAYYNMCMPQVPTVI